MADLSAIRDGLAARLATVPAIRNSYARWPDQVNVPCAIVMPRDGNWREALGGVPSFVFEITLLIAAWKLRGLPRAQEALDVCLDDTGANSVHAAVRGDVTLGGAAHTCDVEGFTDYTSLEVNGAEYLGCKVTVRVWA